jgi:hypothetical protein
MTSKESWLRCWDLANIIPELCAILSQKSGLKKISFHDITLNHNDYILYFFALISRERFS